MSYNDPISKSLTDFGDELTAEFRQLIYSHIPYLKKKFSGSLINVTPHEAWKFRGNLSGLFKRKGMSQLQIWVVCVVNGYGDPTLYDGMQTTFIVPSLQEIQNIQIRNTVIQSDIK